MCEISKENKVKKFCCIYFFGCSHIRRVFKFLFVLICAEEHHSASHSGHSVRVAPVGRLMTPRSLGGNAFDSAADSDDEGTELAAGEDTFFSYEGINHPVDFMSINVCGFLAYFLHLYAHIKIFIMICLILGIL